MSEFEQYREFNPDKMGNVKGWCLQNCRKGYGIKNGKYASAKAAMTADKKAGVFHAGSDVPLNVAVPVYLDTESKYEHIVVCNKGIWWSDKKRISKPKNIFGWTERCDGETVVKIKKSSFLPAKGYWCKGDVDERINKLSIFMRRNYPEYTKAKAIGPIFGKYLESSIKEFQKRTGLYPDGMVGPKTYKMLKNKGFNY